jgi:SAM-dependent methyltransferase
MNQAGFPTLMQQPRRWDVIANFAMTCGYKTFVEVGCKEGRTTGHFLKTVPDSRVIAVDPWCAMPTQKDVKGGETYEEWDFAKIEAEFWGNIGEHKDRCRMLRETSAEAAERLILEKMTAMPEDRCSETITDLSCADIIFIDAAHDYENVKLDIARWWPLVRPGGMLVGHDYNHKWPGVERAVADMFNLMDVGCAPDSIWFLLKGPGIELRSAA